MISKAVATVVGAAELPPQLLLASGVYVTALALGSPAAAGGSIEKLIFIISFRFGLKFNELLGVTIGKT